MSQRVTNSNPTLRIAAALLLLGAAAAPAQSPAADFDAAAAKVQQQLQDSLRELEQLRQQVAAEKVPLNKQLAALEAELLTVRQEYQQKTRLVDSKALDLGNLRNEVKSRQDERNYLSNLLGEYVRNFESRLHIAELRHYAEPVQRARLGPENSNLTEQQVFEAQAAVLTTALDRLQAALGGNRFAGTAIDPDGVERHGSFLLVGPAALFAADDGSGVVGTAEQRLGSLEPAALAFEQPDDTAAAAAVVQGGDGSFVFDPTLGNAHKVEATKETLIEHVEKGGPVMLPILGLAGLALLVALYKWLSLSLTRNPSPRRVQALLDAVARRDRDGARSAAAEIRGPAGAMLQAGVEHLDEPRELIEEVMYERVLATRLRLNRLLPFVAITASSAPLLGLLGTVTGIMETFSLMTLFGSDVKALSGGISEALITTEFGLYVAIPSLLLYAFLSRKAKAALDQMEKAAVAFVNQVGRTPLHEPIVVAEPAPAVAVAPARPAATAEQLRELLASLLVPPANPDARSRAS